MGRHNGFTLVELLVVIMILGTLLAMAVPRYAGFREQLRKTAMKANVVEAQKAVELFHLNQGHYPDDFYEDGAGAYFDGGDFAAEKLGKLPINPWTGREMDPDEFNPEDYDRQEDAYNTDENGPNDFSGYYPGEIVYGVWEPGGAVHPVVYGLVGIGMAGMSVRDFDQDDNAVIFVRHN